MTMTTWMSRRPVSIEAGPAGAFAIGIVAAMLLALVAQRFPDARAG
jgi:hypothetical protein